MLRKNMYSIYKNRIWSSCVCTEKK